MSEHERWVQAMRSLRVYRAKGGPAPHKPLLLLVVLESFENGAVSGDVLELTPEIAFQFCTFWRVVAHRRTQRPDVRMPFHHLQSDGFWTALGADQQPSPDERLTKFACLDPTFASAVIDPKFREQARRILIGHYFQPDEQLSLCALLGLPPLSGDASAEDLEGGAPDVAQERGRDARFRLNVVAAYNYTCALTGYRVMTISVDTIVDAAHIHQFAQSRNDDPQNGITLCKNAHWMFDNGLWTVADDFTVIVAIDHFTEEAPNQKKLSEYHGQRIRLPADESLHPDAAHLAWHRKHKFRG